MKTLDDVLVKYDVIDLIKIDAEGAEMEVLRGSKKLLKTRKPTIIFEINADEKGGFLVFSDFFREMQYEIFKVSANLGEEHIKLECMEYLEPNKHHNMVAIHSDKKSFLKLLNVNR